MLQACIILRVSAASTEALMEEEYNPEVGFETGSKRGKIMKRIAWMIVSFVMALCTLCALCAAFEEAPAEDPGEEVAVPVCRHINDSETQSLSSNIETNIASASFILSWGNVSSDMEMALIMPDGRRIDPNGGETASYQRNASLIYYIIPYPEAGNWTREITAGNVSEMGEDYCAFTVLGADEEAIFNSAHNQSGEAQDFKECEYCDA